MPMTASGRRAANSSDERGSQRPILGADEDGEDKHTHVFTGREVDPPCQPPPPPELVATLLLLVWPWSWPLVAEGVLRKGKPEKIGRQLGKLEKEKRD